MVKTTKKTLSLQKGMKQNLIPKGVAWINYDNQTRKEYQIEVANRFSALEASEISTVDDDWVKVEDDKGLLAEEKIGTLKIDRNEP